jgi:hypothetical protein
MPLDPNTARRIHDEWVARQPANAPTFGGPDGNQHYADDEELWQLIDEAEAAAGATDSWS